MPIRVRKFLFFFLITVTSAGCSNVDPVDKPFPTDTITLKIYDWGWFTDETFQRLVSEPVMKNAFGRSLNK